MALIFEGNTIFLCSIPLDKVHTLKKENTLEFINKICELPFGKINKSVNWKTTINNNLALCHKIGSLFEILNWKI